MRSRTARRSCSDRSAGRKRDRNENNWVVLFYFMLMISMMFQAGLDDQMDVFVWMIRTATRSMHKPSSHQSEQFVLHILKSMQLRSSPFGKEEETIFLHNLRGNLSTHAAIFAGPSSYRYWAVRVEIVVGLIKKLTGRTFGVAEIYHLADKSDWACRGERVPVRDEINFTSKKEMPLLESELVEKITIELEIFKLVHKANECAGYNGIQELYQPITITLGRSKRSRKKRKAIEFEDEDDGYNNTPGETSSIGEVT
ncbi:MAG: hypothetical protein SGPRY_011556 [Prymnesium sp.]